MYIWSIEKVIREKCVQFRYRFTSGYENQSTNFWPALWFEHISSGYVVIYNYGKLKCLKLINLHYWFSLSLCRHLFNLGPEILAHKLIVQFRNDLLYYDLYKTGLILLIGSVSPPWHGMNKCRLLMDALHFTNFNSIYL